MSKPPKGNSLFSDLTELLNVLKRRRQLQVLGLLGLMVISAVAELVTLGAIIPFVGLLVQPEIAFETRFVQGLASWLGFVEPNDLLAPMTIAFACAAMFAGAARVLVVGVNTRLAFMIGADIGADVFSRTLDAPYETHANRNSSEVISGVTRKVDGVVRGIILAVMNILSSGLIFLFSLSALLLIEWRATLAVMTVFGFGYILLSVAMRHRLKRYGKTISLSEGKTFRALSEGLGGIREVILHDKKDHFRSQFRKHDVALRSAQANTMFVAQFPRYVLEALAVVLIAAMAFWLVSTQPSTDGVSGLPILAAIALGGQRMLPALQLTYAGWSQLVGYRPILEDVLALLRQDVHKPLSDTKTLAFNQGVEFKDVSFAYSGTDIPVLREINLQIPRGQTVGLIGETGSGKSTLVDLLMGLLSPTGGQILIDGVPLSGKSMRGWQDRISHVPQAIFLTDGSFAENIAWAESSANIDMARVKTAAVQAQINTLIEAAPGGYEGAVGENGVRLSGGQRQRIGIARALYRRPQVLVFDEATSALDGDTEGAVIDTLGQLSDDLTLVMIAHRLDTLRHCDLILRLDKGVVIWSGSYVALRNAGIEPEA